MRIRLALLAMGVLIGTKALAAPPGTSTAAEEHAGGRLYRAHCASCHGPTGKGDGPDASVFAPRPPDLHRGFLDKFPGPDLVRRVREGKPLDLSLDAAALKSRAADVESVLTHLKRLPVINQTYVERGAEIYRERCAACHGAYGQPPFNLPAGVRVPRSLADPAFQKEHSMDDLAVVVRHGRERMPALTPRIGEDDAKPLAAYVRLLSPGLQLYSTYCRGCHGKDGRGARAPVDKLRLPAVAFDSRYFKSRDPERIRTSVWHMLADKPPAMPHYEERLDDDQARAIIEFLKKN